MLLREDISSNNNNQQRQQQQPALPPAQPRIVDLNASQVLSALLEPRAVRDAALLACTCTPHASSSLLISEKRERTQLRKAAQASVRGLGAWQDGQGVLVVGQLELISDDAAVIAIKHRSLPFRSSSFLQVLSLLLLLSPFFFSSLSDTSLSRTSFTLPPFRATSEEGLPCNSRDCWSARVSLAHTAQLKRERARHTARNREQDRQRHTSIAAQCES
eukprot:41075-Rhodomonas_salina.1